MRKFEGISVAWIAIIVGALWYLWTLSVADSTQLFVVATRDFVKDLALPLAILLAGGLLAQKSTELLQTRSALLPLVYEQMRSAWAPVLSRLFWIRHSYETRKTDDEAMERCYLHLLILMRNMETVSERFGFIHLGSEEAEESVHRAQILLYQWCCDVLGRNAYEQALDVVPIDHVPFARILRDVAAQGPVVAGREQFAARFAVDATHLTVLMSAVNVLAEILQREANLVVRLWYPKRPLYEAADMSSSLRYLETELADISPALALAMKIFAKSVNLYRKVAKTA